jgi:hypothetical protein
VVAAAKVIPGLYPTTAGCALRYPLGYWNELALLAAASVPIGLWLARRCVSPADCSSTRRSSVVVLTYSRVGIVLAVLVALVYLCLDERRLESVGVLAVAWIAGRACRGPALSLPGVADDGQPTSVRVHDGLLFGLALVVGGRRRRRSCCRYLVTRAR